VERTELERFKGLLDEHHYLGSVKAVGERLQYCSVARYSRKFSHVNCDGSFGTESGISTVLSIC
jgi:hypothetical protein